MKHLNLKLYVWAILIITLVIYAIYVYTSMFFTVYKGSVDYLKPIPSVLSIDLIFISIFVKWLWKWKALYPWFVPFPNLNGTWKGVLKSNWICPDTGKNPDEIPIILTIHQTFTNVSCVMRTGEMCSESFSSDFVINTENEKPKLIYSYRSDPKADIKYRSPPHFGTAILSIVNNKSELYGEYWSSRETTGTIQLNFWKKDKIDIYKDEFGIHPMSK